MKQNGFTLIEVLLVVSIIVIVSTIALLRYNDAQNVRELDNAAQQLVGDLRLMQQQGINADIDPNDNNKRILRQMTFKQDSPYGYCIKVNNNIVKEVTFNNSINVVWNGTPISFDINGSINGTDQQIAVILKSGVNSRNIVIDTNGRVQIN